MARRCAANMSISFVEASRTAYPSGKLIQFLSSFSRQPDRSENLSAGMFTEILTERLKPRNLEVQERSLLYRAIEQAGQLNLYART
jgi:hypothetical protein